MDKKRHFEKTSHNFRKRMEEERGKRRRTIFLTDEVPSTSSRGKKTTKTHYHQPASTNTRSQGRRSNLTTCYRMSANPVIPQHMKPDQPTITSVPMNEIIPPVTTITPPIQTSVLTESWPAELQARINDAMSQRTVQVRTKFIHRIGTLTYRVIIAKTGTVTVTTMKT